MTKNIALFIDGTWNRADLPKGHKTNVAKLHLAAAVRAGASHQKDGVPVARHDSAQVVHYLRGVGTGGRVDRLFAGITGFGSEERIKEAYLFLALNYKPGDRVYLFGFSRGAFAARALAGFVGRVGLLFEAEASRKNVDTAYALYERYSFDKRYFIDKISRRLEIPRQVVERVEPIPIWFIGVWDTVKRLGLKIGRHHPGESAFHDRRSLPGYISHARHALALHDLRPEFEPTLWEGWKDPQSLEQVWFRGAHSDIGGGYRNTELSDVAFDWMAREAMRYCLKCDTKPLPGGGPSVRSPAVHFAHLPRLIAQPLAPRDVLRTWSAPSKKLLIKSFRVHETACNQLLSHIPTRFTSEDPNDVPDADGRLAAEHEPLVAEVDLLTLFLHIAVSMKHRKTPDPMTAQPGLHSTTPREWWQEISLVDVRSCASAIKAIESVEIARISSAVPLYLLCGGNQADLADRIASVTDGICTAATSDPTSSANRDHAMAWCARLTTVLDSLSRLPNTLSDEVKALESVARTNLEQCKRALSHCTEAILKSHRPVRVILTRNKPPVGKPPCTGTPQPTQTPDETE